MLNPFNLLYFTLCILGGWFAPDFGISFSMAILLALILYPALWLVVYVLTPAKDTNN